MCNTSSLWRGNQGQERLQSEGKKCVSSCALQLLQRPLAAGEAEKKGLGRIALLQGTGFGHELH